MYVNTRSFFDGTVMRRANEENESPKQEHIDRGLVREVKVVSPSAKDPAPEQKDVVPRQRKRKSAKPA